jgi:hypothetical protein
VANTRLISAYLRWASIRSALARGWWLATSLYLVVVADLSPSQLVLIGVFADTVGRRSSLVVAHVVMGSGMALTGVVTSYPLIVASQCLWGLGWAFSSGSDVAWITDELDRPDLIDRVLVTQARRELRGGAAGIVGFGALAWATSLSTVVVIGGIAMVVLGIAVVARWPETTRPGVPATARLRHSSAILRQGFGVARTERIVAAVLVANLFLHGSEEGFGRLFERRLIDVGLPSTPSLVVWFTAIALAAAGMGAVTLRIVEARIDTPNVARHSYGIAAAVGVVGLLALAHAPTASAAVAAALLVRGVASPTTRAAATILVNRRAPTEARATVHSLLSQTENAGEAIFGLALAGLAASTSPTVVLTTCAVLLCAAGGIVTRTGP